MKQEEHSLETIVVDLLIFNAFSTIGPFFFLADLKTIPANDTTYILISF